MIAVFNKIRSFILGLSLPPGDEWQLAIRRRQDKSLFEGNFTGFRLIKNSFRYWYADPFLVEHQGRTYLYVEMYDRIKGKGVLGVALVDDNNPLSLDFEVCVNLPFHLSYPCVFKQGDVYYMIPECYQSGHIYKMKCSRFPDKWELDEILWDGYAVDTTPIPASATPAYFTTFFENPHKRLNDNLYYLSEGKINEICLNNKKVRGAGHMFKDDKGWVRPAQDCSGGYGSALCFYRLSDTGSFMDSNSFIEIRAEDIILSTFSQKKFRGLHTYNCSSKYEIIDLKYREYHSFIYFVKNFKIWVCQRFLHHPRKS